MEVEIKQEDTPEEIEKKSSIVLWTANKNDWSERNKDYSEKLQYEPR